MTAAVIVRARQGRECRDLPGLQRSRPPGTESRSRHSLRECGTRHEWWMRVPEAVPTLGSQIPGPRTPVSNPVPRTFPIGANLATYGLTPLAKFPHQIECRCPLDQCVS